MDKFLFTDGTSGVKEAHSREELLALINSAAEPGNIRIWIFSSQEWTDYNAFLRQYPGFEKKDPASLTNRAADHQVNQGRRRPFLQRTFFIVAALAGALLVFNFTSAGWEPSTRLRVTAARPANVPVMDIDSLIGAIEAMRGKLIDKGTRYNLRLRNNWPEFIFLRLQAEKEVKGSSTRFLGIEVSIDNATGFVLDQAGVQLTAWRNGKSAPADTLQFNDIRFDNMQVRRLAQVIHCDSLSVSFKTIRAKAFNFCYSDKVKNSSGNSNDRWFCREGKTDD